MEVKHNIVMKTRLKSTGRAFRSAGAASSAAISVADEVWVAAALLHREQPRRDDFSIDDIVERVRRERIASRFRPSVYAHVVQHCVANRPPSPLRLRYLIETRPGFRKLFRSGYGWDYYRERGRTLPTAEDLPAKHRHLLEWYHDVYNAAHSERAKNDSILELCGLGKEIWEGVDPDDYVRGLREGWE